LDKMLNNLLYSTDASMYQIGPERVLMPDDREALLRILHDEAWAATSIVPRGAGTSLVGQSVGAGIVLDCSRHFNRVLELNIAEGWVRVEPGLVCSELNNYLKPYGYCFAPDPATLNRATIGGMIANNSSGMRSVRYGMSIDHVIEIELALASGEVLQLGPLDAGQLSEKCAIATHEDNIYRGILELLHRHADLIRQRYPKVIRRSGGYPLDALIDVDKFNPAKLICGSEGTLGVILSTKLKLTRLFSNSALCLAHFDSVDSALRVVPSIVARCPSAVELLDGTVLRQAREHLSTRAICSVLHGEPEGVLVIELQGDDRDKVAADIRSIADEVGGRAYACPVMIESKDIKAVWQMRSSALGLMTTVKGLRKPVPYIEDAAVPLENLADYVAEVSAVCQKYNQPVAFFGHASVGLLHIRPMHDLHRADEIASMKQIQEEVFQLVLKYGGSWSGEHGDGIVRGGFNRRFFGDELYEAFRELKRLFDPEWRMNPGKVIDTPPMESNLRYGPDYKPIDVRTMFHYRNDGGILAAVEQCTGVGECRKTISGVMCPSYMVTKEEMHSTRGRANTLRLVLSGQLGVDALASKELKMVMDLCLSCKGCKGECPNSVDMAKLKSEVLHHFYKKKRISLRSRVFANLYHLSGAAVGSQAKYVNKVMEYKAFRMLGKSVLGLDPQRKQPAFAEYSLSGWYRKREASEKSSFAYQSTKNAVVLFNDTYMEYFQPEVGKACIGVLEKAGYRTYLATFGDSQRTAISQGLLDKAKREGTKLFERLDRFADGLCPIVVCEPSCASALKDDLPDLIDNVILARRVAARVLMIDEFIERELAAGRSHISFSDTTANDHLNILVHTHCHQHTLGGAAWTHRLLSRIPGAIVEDTKAGCCGMAGSFGYEAEHADISKEIAAQRLLPRLAKAGKDAVIVANGFSCRHQIADLSDRRPLHSLEVLSMYMDEPMD
jgi:FAD/FMN-containing dehydrogenase/Fe-S oxidoreductase